MTAGERIYFRFSCPDESDNYTPKTGLSDSDFTKNVSLNGTTVSSSAITITEVGDTPGDYIGSYTPTSGGQLIIQIRYAAQKAIFQKEYEIESDGSVTGG